MGKPTDIRTIGAALHFLPVQTRVPLKFGTEVLTQVTCARARVTVEDGGGNRASGWGETPLSVQWVWPGSVAYHERHETIKKFCVQLTELWSDFRKPGHPMEIGHDFQAEILPAFLKGFNMSQRRGGEPMPWLAALLCCSAFDIAVHDAFGNLTGTPVFQTYNAEFMNRDLSSYLQPAIRSNASFAGKYPVDFLVRNVPVELAAWHLVGGLDPLEERDKTGNEPNDGYPSLLADWIQRDGLKCLKIKLRGNDAAWDYERIIRVGAIAINNDAHWLSVDFNCTVTDPEYVNAILDRLRDEFPRIYGMILYVEQPFPYELEQYPIDVHSLSSRKPLFLDESAHDWQHVRRGRELGWTGVALKTCKTQSGALLSACWARAHGMSLMVQDLTNPMLAQIPHVQLAANVGTIMGVETNGMQFYPEASRLEAEVHPGIYRREHGRVNLASIRGAGFGYRLGEIKRQLPQAVLEAGCREV